MKSFDEETLRQNIHAVWGPAGAHADLIGDLIRKARLHDEVVRQYTNLQAWCEENAPDYPNPGHPYT